MITEPSTEGRRRTEPQSDESSRDGGRKIDVRPAAGDNAVRKEGGRGRDGEGDGQRTVIRQRVRRPESGNCSFQYQIHEMNEPINFGWQMLTEILFIKSMQTFPYKSTFYKIAWLYLISKGKSAWNLVISAQIVRHQVKQVHI